MKLQTQTIDVSALRTQRDDDTIEIRILRPHETYSKNPNSLAPDTFGLTMADIDDVLS